MERKSRLKRERGVAGLAATAAQIRRAAEPEEPETSAPAPVPAPPAPPPSRSAGPRERRQAVGARVARVAVDDETWAAFREMCGSTPASIRLGELVDAEVERFRNPAAEPDLASAVQAIRSHVDELETLVRRIAPAA